MTKIHVRSPVRYEPYMIHTQLEDKIMDSVKLSTDYSIYNVNGYDKWWQKPMMLFDKDNNLLARYSRLRREKLYVVPCDRLDTACTVAIIVGLILSVIVWYYGKGLDLTQKYHFSDNTFNQYASDDEQYLWLLNEFTAMSDQVDIDQMVAIKAVHHAINTFDNGSMYRLVESQKNNKVLQGLLSARALLIDDSSFNLKHIQDIQDKIDAQEPILKLDRNDPNSYSFIKLLATLKGTINRDRSNKKSYMLSLREQLITLKDKINENNKCRNQLNTLNAVWTGQEYVWTRMALTGLVGAVTTWNIFKRTTIHKNNNRTSTFKTLGRTIRDTFIEPPVNAYNDTLYAFNKARSGLETVVKQAVESVRPVSIGPSSTHVRD